MVIVNNELGEVWSRIFLMYVCVCVFINIVSGLSHTPFAVVQKRGDECGDRWDLGVESN